MSKYEVKGAIEEHDDVERKLQQPDRLWRYLDTEQPAYVGVKDVRWDGVVIPFPTDIVKDFLRVQGDKISKRKDQLEKLFENMTKLIYKNGND